MQEMQEMLEMVATGVTQAMQAMQAMLAAEAMAVVMAALKRLNSDICVQIQMWQQPLPEANLRLDLSIINDMVLQRGALLHLKLPGA
jgi:hypothetical protein